jgi:hypothetical protein
MPSRSNPWMLQDDVAASPSADPRNTRTRARAIPSAFGSVTARSEWPSPLTSPATATSAPRPPRRAVPSADHVGTGPDLATEAASASSGATTMRDGRMTNLLARHHGPARRRRRAPGGPGATGPLESAALADHAAGAASPATTLQARDDDRSNRVRNGCGPAIRLPLLSTRLSATQLRAATELKSSSGRDLHPADS